MPAVDDEKVGDTELIYIWIDEKTRLSVKRSSPFNQIFGETALLYIIFIGNATDFGVRDIYLVLTQPFKTA
jgi:hypothetical protein